MVLFMGLLLTLLCLAIFSVLAIGAGGAVFVIVFGDVLVCAFIIVSIIKFITKKNNKE